MSGPHARTNYEDRHEFQWRPSIHGKRKQSGVWLAHQGRKPILEIYHNNLSVNAQKVRIVLAEKNLTWTGHHLSFVKGEHLTPEFKALNPRGLVRVLVHNGNLFAVGETSTVDAIADIARNCRHFRY